MGGYPQTVFAPLVGTLLLALVASYIISITAVPLLSLYFLSIKNPILLKVEDGFHSLISRINDVIQSSFASIVKAGICYKSVSLLYAVILIALFVTSLKIVMPVVGQELMPPMDTGTVNIKIITESNLPIGKSEAIMEKVNEIVKSQGKLLRLSGSIGSSSGIDHLSIVATYINRHEREEDIWQIAKVLRLEISKIPNIKQLEITPYGEQP